MSKGDTSSPAGWGQSPASRKWHYYLAGSSFSLCGRIGWFFGATEQGNDKSPDNCAECRRRKKRVDDKGAERATGEVRNDR